MEKSPSDVVVAGKKKQSGKLLKDNTRGSKQEL